MTMVVRVAGRSANFRRGVVLVSVLAVCACDPSTQPGRSAGGVPPAAPLSFPQLAPRGEQDFPQALVTGELVLQDGCLRLLPLGEDTSYLIVWPAHVTFEREGDQIRVVDPRSQMSVLQGQVIQLGGGEVPAGLQGLRVPIPRACQGPIWLSSGLVEM